MTLIKKSDVHRHTSTKSREDREIKRPYGAKAVPVKSGQPAATPAEAKVETPPAEPAK